MKTAFLEEATARDGEKDSRNSRLLRRTIVDVAGIVEVRRVPETRNRPRFIATRLNGFDLRVFVLWEHSGRCYRIAVSSDKK